VNIRKPLNGRVVMRCAPCRRAMVKISDVSLNGSDALVIKAWQCAGCGDPMEKIQTLSAQGEMRRIIYEARPFSLCAHA
jgi:hypothetical protein